MLTRTVRVANRADVVNDTIITAAIAGGVGLLGSLGSLLLAHRAERERRNSEERGQQIAHAHELRLALRGDRVTAYRRLSVAIRSQTEKHREHADLWSRRRLLSDEFKTAHEDRQQAIRAMDANEEALRASSAASREADREVEAALDDTELVASSHVADAARRLSSLIVDMSKASHRHAQVMFDDVESVDAWLVVQAAEADVRAAWAALREAIRQELRLDA